MLEPAPSGRPCEGDTTIYPNHGDYALALLANYASEMGGASADYRPFND